MFSIASHISISKKDFYVTGNRMAPCVIILFHDFSRSHTLIEEPFP